MAIRRTREQWQALVEKQAASDLSAPRFCDQQGIGYASFCSWRKRLSSAADDVKPEAPALSAGSGAEAAPGFVDLSSLTGSTSEGNSETGAWTIVLSLGNGVELTLSQAR